MSGRRLDLAADLTGKAERIAAGHALADAAIAADSAAAAWNAGRVAGLREAAAAILARQDAIDAKLAAEGVLPSMYGRICANDFAQVVDDLASHAALARHP